MRKSSYLVIFIMLFSLVVAPNVQITGDKAVNFFDAWRPQSYPAGIGCHNAGLPNTQVAGEVSFGASMIVVSPGENFTLNTMVSDFAGTLTSGDVLVGFNILDGDNSLFIDETIADVGHKLDGNGDSTTVYTPSFTAPEMEGSYVLEAYVVTGNENYFNYASGAITVVVSSGIAGVGYVDEVINHYDSIKDTSTTGYKWPETMKDGETTYKPGMIKGASSIGNLMLDIYEEKSRSALFFGLNNEEIALPLDLATGAGDWIVSIQTTNGSGSFWYKTYFKNDTASTTTVHLPYYEGVAGIASYLGRLYRITHDVAYLNAATAGLDFLISIANTTNGWTAWTEDWGQDIQTKLSTRWSKGSTGMGTVMLEFYRLTGNVAYLNAAKGVYKFLDDTKKVDADGSYWYRYATDASSGIYLGRWHGVAGISSFLMDLYEVTGFAAHKDLALAGMDYVMAHADDDGFGGVWFENAVGSSEYQAGWSRGGAGIASMLMRADKLDSTGGYTDLLDKIFKHYETWAIPIGDGWVFNDSVNIDTPAASNLRIATGIGHGTAGIGMYLLQAYETTGDVKYRMAATKIGLGLKELALDNGLWEKSSSEKYISNNVYYGVGGVATFFHNYDIMGDPTSFTTALDATKYLLDFAEKDGAGLKWAEKEGGVYKTGVLKGAAGNALQLLNVYQKLSTEPLFGGLTTNATMMYLDKAEEAMIWLENVAVNLAGGKGWYEAYYGNNTEVGTVMKNAYYPGAAGIGDTFLRVSQATGDQSYMTYAQAAGDYLVGIANTTVGYAWREKYADDINLRSTRWSYGSGGIGTFFLNLAIQTGSTAYMDVATGTADFFIQTAISQDKGVSWYRYADDASSGTYLGRWHGSAGTASFFMDMAAVNNNVSYMETAIDALDYVLSQANITGDTASWENAVGSGEYQTGFSRGGAGIADQFLRMFLATGNSTYTDYIEMALNYYLNNVADVNAGWAWVDSVNYITPAAGNPRIATGLGHGLAGIVMMATEVFHFTRNPKAFMIMANGLDYFNDLAISSSTGTHWLKSSTEQYFDTTLYYGTSGVAFALSEMSLFANEAPKLDATFAFDDTKMTVTADVSVMEDIAIDMWELTVDTTVVKMNATDGVYTFNVSALAAGDHTVKVKVTDVGGLSDEATFSFKIVAEETTTSQPVTTTSSVPETSTIEESEGGFLPFNFFFFLMAFVAIPVVKKFRK